MYTIGIDLGGTNIKGGICDVNGNIVKKMSVPTDRNGTADQIVDDMVKLCVLLLRETGISNKELEYIGIATPGTADIEKGEMVYCNNLPFLRYPIIKEFKKRFGDVDVYIENDANAAALGEAVCGGAKGCKNMVLITLGTGVGSGIIIDGKVYAGFNYSGAELGHMVIDVGGAPCTCGRKGCFEAYSSATALINQTKAAMEKDSASLMWDRCGGDINKADGQTSFRAADKGDESAKQVVREYIKGLACGIINIINIFQPQVLCIGGGLSNEGDNLFLPLMEVVEKEQYSRFCDKKTEIRMAELGNDAGIIGAAMLGRQ